MTYCATHYRILKLLKEKKYACRKCIRTDPTYHLWVHFVQSVYITRVNSLYKKNYNKKIKIKGGGKKKEGEKRNGFGTPQYKTLQGLELIPVKV